ncbi:hypothetical protein ACFQX4_27295 [Roseomonas sp. GCM10028921]
MAKLSWHAYLPGFASALLLNSPLATAQAVAPDFSQMTCEQVSLDIVRRQQWTPGSTPFGLPADSWTDALFTSLLARFEQFALERRVLDGQIRSIQGQISRAQQGVTLRRNQASAAAANAARTQATREAYARENQASQARGAEMLADLERRRRAENEAYAARAAEARSAQEAATHQRLAAADAAGGWDPAIFESEETLTAYVNALPLEASSLRPLTEFLRNNNWRRVHRRRTDLRGVTHDQLTSLADQQRRDMQSETLMGG